LIPSSESIVVVTNQKMSRRNAMSAMEPALISANSRRAMFLAYLKMRLTSAHTMAVREISPKR